MKKEIITDVLRKLSYKNVSIDTTEGRNTIANELLTRLNLGMEHGDEWRIEQFNRNRAPEDHVKTIEEMDKAVEELFNKDNKESPEPVNNIYEMIQNGFEQSEIDSLKQSVLRLEMTNAELKDMLRQQGVDIV